MHRAVNATLQAPGTPCRLRRRLARLTVALLAAPLVLLAPACGTGEPGGGEPGNADGPPPRVGDPLRALPVQSLAGEPVDLARYRGRAVLLNLWATWCPPCRAEMPYLQVLHERYRGRGLAVVGISVDDGSAQPQVEAFLEEIGAGYDQLLDPAMVSMDRLGVLGLPATFLVDAEGTVTDFRLGPISEDDAGFVEAIEAILPRDPGGDDPRSGRGGG